MLDNLTGGSVIRDFLRGNPSEDLPYSLNPTEGRDRLFEGMDLVLKALTEPQPFSWEGGYYRFRTVSVCPRPVQQPLPPVIVATRSESMIQYPADRRLGLAIPFDSVDQVAKVTQKYKQLCQEAGWEPTPDQIVYRNSILLAETDSLAVDRLASLGLGERGLNLRSSLTQAVLAAREGREFDLRHPQVLINGNQTARASRQPITFVGGPDTIIKGLKEFHEQCGLGVVDLGFQHSGTRHAEVMKGIKLFGREVLPEIKQF